MQDRSVSQSLFLEGVPVPDELSLRVLLSQPFSLLFEILCLFPMRSRQVQVPRCAVVWAQAVIDKNAAVLWANTGGTLSISIIIPPEIHDMK